MNNHKRTVLQSEHNFKKNYKCDVKSFEAFVTKEPLFFNLVNS